MSFHGIPYIDPRETSGLKDLENSPTSFMVGSPRGSMRGRQVSRESHNSSNASRTAFDRSQCDVLNGWLSPQGVSQRWISTAFLCGI